MTSERPELSVSLSAEEFGSFYYLKKEFILFCRTEGLRTSGGKPDLAERIAAYLETGEKRAAGRRQISRPREIISAESIIGENVVFSQDLRAFFADNKGLSPNDAIVCRRRKKGLRGHNRYEAEDLAALNDG